MVTAARFAQGLTFDQYVAFTASPENLAREASPNGAGRGFSEYLRKACDGLRVTDAQASAWRWLVDQPGGPARVLAISEEWSSDCRRIFPRDGQRFSAAPEPDPNQSPNADLMAQFLNRRGGQRFQSIPVIVFYTREMVELYRYVEFLAVYHKDRLVGAVRAARPGETAEQTRDRGQRDFRAMLESPFFSVWRDAAHAEWLSMLYERARVGSLA
jgi:hypothetical protein